MLILSRKIGQRIVLTRHDERLGELVVADVCGTIVRLGLDLDEHVQILRAELVESQPNNPTGRQEAG